VEVACVTSWYNVSNNDESVILRLELFVGFGIIYDVFDTRFFIRFFLQTKIVKSLLLVYTTQVEIGRKQCYFGVH